jgi:hypothetical protein
MPARFHVEAEGGCYAHILAFFIYLNLANFLILSILRNSFTVDAGSGMTKMTNIILS